MALFDGLLGKSKRSNFDRIRDSLQTHLGVQLAQPPQDVIDKLEAMPPLELVNFDNMHSFEGMEELFRARSIHATVDQNARTVALALALQSASDGAAAVTPKIGQGRILRISEGYASTRIVKPAALPGAITAAAPAPVSSGPVPPSLEHLEALERLVPQVVDFFIRHGRLTSADKDVLKKIQPVDYSLQARIVALERWRDEMNRRMRGIHVARTAQHLMLATSGMSGDADETEGALARRYDAVTLWLSKVIKAFERSGVKFTSKPMWLPH